MADDHAAITSENVRGGFRGAGLVPFDPEKVISQLDIKLRTPTPTGPPLPAADSWVSKTPQNANEASLQTIHVKDCINKHQTFSFNLISTANTASPQPRLTPTSHTTHILSISLQNNEMR